MMPPSNSTEARYRLASWILLGVLLLVGAQTIGDYGMGWDEITRWKSGDLKLAYYETLFASDTPLDVVRSVANEPYPGFFDLSLSLLHRWTGWDRFVLGHWQAFLFGLVGLGASWRIGAIFGGARLGFWAVIVLVLSPVFYGHWFQNPKDIPFAATYTLGLLGLIEFVRRYPRLSRRWLVLASVLCGLCMATRVAGMVLLAYLSAAVAVVFLRELWETRRSMDLQASTLKCLKWLVAPVIAGVIAYLTLLPWWPAAHKNILSVAGTTLQQLHVSASEIPLFFRGEILFAADAPHYYAVWMFGIKATECLLVGLLLGLPIAWLRLRAFRQSTPDLRLAPQWTLLLLGGVFPLLYLTVSAPALHNGVRHFLFAFPALSVLAAWAYLQTADQLRSNVIRLRLAQGVFAVLLLLPLIHLVRLHPYQYVYYNAFIGGPSGAYGRYEGEYWFTSTKHALEQLEQFLQEHPQLKPSGEVRLFILGPWQVAEPFLPPGYALTADVKTADFLILNTQMRVHERFAGEPLFTIERMGLPISEVRLVSGLGHALKGIDSL